MTAPRTIVLDGTEGRTGRALLLISALSHCVADLAGDHLRFISVSDSAVLTAIEVMKWETGLDVEIAKPENSPTDASVFAKAAIYGAIVFRSKTHLHLQEATFFGVPNLVALQFPEREELCANSVSLIRAAHDPKYFARRLVSMVSTYR